MSFWTDGTLEPKRQNRWTIQFEGIHAGTVYFATKVGRPEIEVTNKEHKYLNHTFNYPGRVTWKPVSLTVVDLQGGVSGSISDTTTGEGNTMNSLLRVLRDSGYVVPNAQPTLADSVGAPAAVDLQASTISKAGAIGATKGIHINMLNASGQVIEHWHLKNAYITSFKPSELSYEGEDLSVVELTITYDYCEYGPSNETNLFKPGGTL